MGSVRLAKEQGRRLVVISLLVGLFSPAQAAVPALERDALIAFYDSTNGDGWSKKTGWKTPPLAGDGFALPGKECTWYGVGCDSGETTVLDLDLPGNQLAGSLPPQLGNLANLEFLALYNNQLMGSIPPELENAAALLYVYLGNNELSGSIPPELGNLPGLVELSLYDNRLSGSIPPALAQLASLEILFLDGNDLSGSIPPQLGSLANLRVLFLFRNRLSGAIPPEIGSLASLETTYLNDNQLRGPLPLELLNLTGLLDASSNFCRNYLYTPDDALRSFLNAKQIGGDWESCQNAGPPLPVPALPVGVVWVLCLLLAGCAFLSLTRSDLSA